MNILNYIKDKTCFIIPKEEKKKILLHLSKEKKLCDIKVYSKEEIINKISLLYSKKTIYYLIKKHDMTYEIALMYLDNMKYVSNKEYNNEKLDYLVKLKQELISLDLICENQNIECLKKYKMYIYGYDYIDNFYVDKLKELFNIEILNEEEIKKTHTINEFKTMEDEVIFVFDKIKELLNQKIDINKIKIVNSDASYSQTLKRIANFYNIPINIKRDTALYSISSIREFYDELICKRDIQKAYEFLMDNYNINENINKQLVSILNEYTFNSEIDETILYMIKKDLQQTSAYKEKEVNSIEILSLNDASYDDYVFLINFNEGMIPKTYKDDDYITDNIKDLVNLDSTCKKNELLTKNIINKINNINNLTITYKLKDDFNTYLVSALIYKMDYKINKINEYNYNSSYKNNIFNLGVKLDRLIKYGTKDEQLDILYKNYENIPYLTYDNKYKKIDEKLFDSYVENKLNLSYSSIENYNECSFKYYLSNILKINKIEKRFKTEIGTIFHYILSKYNEENFDLDKEYDYQIKQFTTNKEIFFAKKLKEDLKFIIDVLNEQEKYMNLPNSKEEEKFYVNYDKRIKITFTGIVDKIKYKKENDKTYVALIDYKTGNPDISLNNINYGLNMQLPIYLYLVNNKFKNITPVGIYYQKILNNEVTYKKNKTYLDQKKDLLKLSGYSNYDENVLKYIDKNYKDSNIISSMKMTSKGFYAYSKVLKEKEFEKLNNIVDSNINIAIDNILNTKFDINPKIIENKNISCEYCEFKDVCFKTQNDNKYLEKVTLKDLLGSDEDE